MSDPSKAKQLKDEGNALFARKQFQEAKLKYSEAIELDSSNAVLYANKAACRLHLKEYFLPRKCCRLILTMVCRTAPSGTWTPNSMPKRSILAFS